MTKLAEALRRRTDAQAALAEIEVQLRNGELVRIDDTAADLESQYTNVRAKLMLIPSKAAPQIQHMKEADRRTLLQGFVEEALSEASATFGALSHAS